MIGFWTLPLQPPQPVKEYEGDDDWHDSQRHG